MVIPLAVVVQRLVKEGREVDAIYLSHGVDLLDRVDPVDPPLTPLTLSSVPLFFLSRYCLRSPLQPWLSGWRRRGRRWMPSTWRSSHTRSSLPPFLPAMLYFSRVVVTVQRAVVVERLVKEGREVDAIYLAHGVDLLDQVDPVDLLKRNLREIRTLVSAMTKKDKSLQAE
ncbi:unnamed protein product, partial [Closterium sp. NIES-53]